MRLVDHFFIATILSICTFSLNPYASATPTHGESIYNLKSNWTTQDGRVANLIELRGKPVIAAMVYTNCEGACPMIVADMKRLEASLNEPSPSAFSFALFSFDSTRDTPTQLKTFAVNRKLDLNHWTLFHGEKKAVRDLAAVLGINFKQDLSGNFVHSNVIVLLDREGLIRDKLEGLNQSQSEFLSKAREITTH
jgi:protein SCO1/2